MNRSDELDSFVREYRRRNREQWWIDHGAHVLLVVSFLTVMIVVAAELWMP